MKEVMLTTTDNPYDPFTQFDEWYAFDESHGYHTCAYLARISAANPTFDDDRNAYENEKAIDEICSFNLLGIYKKVEQEEQQSTKQKKE